MHIDELCSRFGISRHVIHEYVRDGLVLPPDGYGRHARYGPRHVAAIAAYRALNDLVPSSPRHLARYLREEGIDVVAHLRRLEAAIRDHGIAPGAL